MCVMFFMHSESTSAIRGSSIHAAAVAYVVRCSVWQKKTGCQSCVGASWPIKSEYENHILWP
jgi:hypothetical protein